MKSGETERVQTILQNLGKLEGLFIKMADVQRVRLYPVTGSGYASWVLIIMTSKMSLVQEFAERCRRNEVGSPLSPEQVRVEVLNALLDGELLAWSKSEMIVDALLLPHNWWEFSVKQELEAVYSFSSKGQLEKLNRVRDQSIAVIG
jgi:hypothetical protein